MISPYSNITTGYTPTNNTSRPMLHPQYNTEKITSNIQTYGIPLAVGTGLSVGLGLIMKVSKPFLFFGILVINPIAYAVGVYLGKNKQ